MRKPQAFPIAAVRPVSSDRALAEYINDVRGSCLDNGGHDDLVFSCMTSILIDFRLDVSPSALGALIAEHG